MGRKLGQIVLCTLVLAGASFGCHRSVVQNKQPSDPLLLSKKPVEGRLRGGDTGATARAEMIPPPTPAAGVDPASTRPAAPVQLGMQSIFGGDTGGKR